MLFRIAITDGDDGYFVARCLSLKSCWSQGKTPGEALANIREAIELYLEPDPTEIAQYQGQEIVEITL